MIIKNEIPILEYDDSSLEVSQMIFRERCLMFRLEQLYSQNVNGRH